MKPVRLKKNDVVHAVHTTVDRARIVSGASPLATLANPAGGGWPACWVCTEKRMAELRDGVLVGRAGLEQKWVPVEEYAIVDQRPGEEDLRASCSHGNPGGRVYTETKVITMPRTWSDVKKRHKRAALIFFAPGTAVPIGGNEVLA